MNICSHFYRPQQFCPRADTPLPLQIPPRQTPPRQTSPGQTSPWADTPPGRHPEADTTPWQTPPAQCILGYTPLPNTPPCPVHAGIPSPCPVHAGIPPPAQYMLGYGQQAGGTHPTRMHSCFGFFRLFASEFSLPNVVFLNYQQYKVGFSPNCFFRYFLCRIYYSHS